MEVLQSNTNPIKASRWVRCPICKEKTRVKVNENTVLLNFPLFCPHCHEEYIINIVQFKMTVSKEPDA